MSAGLTGLTRLPARSALPALPGQDSGLSLGVRLFHAVRLWLGSVLYPDDE